MPIIPPYNLETLCAAIGNRLPREDAETLHVKEANPTRDMACYYVLATSRRASRPFLLTANGVQQNGGHTYDLQRIADMLAVQLREPPTSPFVEHVSEDGGIISDQGAAALNSPAEKPSPKPHWHRDYE